MENNHIYKQTIKTMDGQEKSMADFKGKVLLIVNTASKCGYTPQYEGLNKLYETYKKQGFEVLGFPCNQFGNQEPESEAAIKQFCELTFNITFPLFAKIEVNGDNATPLYKYLKKSSKGFLGTEFIKWNFTKFLVDKEGNVVQRFAPQVKPEDIASAIEEQLQK